MGKRCKPVKFDPALEAALNATGIPWTIEPGSKHFQIRLAGRYEAELERTMEKAQLLLETMLEQRKRLQHD